MSAFTDLVASDRDIFIDLDFFGENHSIDGVTVKIVIDNDKLEQLKAGMNNDIVTSSILFYVRTADIGSYAPQQIINFDKKISRIDLVQEDMGITTIAISQARVS